MNRTMNSREIGTALRAALMGELNEEDTAIVEGMHRLNWSPKIYSVRSFRDAGVLTRDEGIVVDYTDGSEFQIAITRSKYQANGG